MPCVTKVWLMVTPPDEQFSPGCPRLFGPVLSQLESGSLTAALTFGSTMSPILLAQRGLLFQLKSSSFRNCWKDSESLLCHFPDAHSHRPGLNGWLMATSHRWPYPVCENVVTCFILPHAIFQMLSHLPSRLFLIRGEERKTAAVAAALAWRNTADDPKTGIGGAFSHSAMWGQFKFGWSVTRKQAQHSGTVGCAAWGRTQESQWCILAALAAQFWIQSDDLTSLVQTKISQNHHEILYRRSWIPDDTSPCLQKEVSSGSTCWIT